MNRNTEYKFDYAPQAEIRRSTFSGLSHSTKTTFNVGDVVPILCEPIYPGDTFKLKSSKVVRMQTLLTPMMDNIFLDVYYFFVPYRLVWEHWEQFAGGSLPDESPWIPVPDYSIPQISAPVESGGYKIGSLADYFGYPTGISGYKASALPFRAYAKIINDWFRDENLSQYYDLPLGDSDVQAVQSTSNEVDVIKYAVRPVKAAKYHDYFTSCLPAPQKGPDVTVPGLLSEIPIITDRMPNRYYAPAGSNVQEYNEQLQSAYPLMFDHNSNHSEILPSVQPFDWNYTGNTFAIARDTFNFKSGSIPTSNIGKDSRERALAGMDMSLTPVNLIGYHGNTSTSINQLRQAFQIQRLLEKDARGGTRYIELLKAHFGVTSPDARLQRSEYLGGSRFPINIHQVTQTSSTVDTSPLGDTAAMSVTADIHSDFTKSFVEHGLLIGLACARYEHTYQQGLPRYLSAKNRYDFYWPVLANLGEMGVKVKEIYLSGDSGLDDLIFGYQEAWADLRFSPNRVTGEMRSNHVNSLDCWHLADNYESQPFLSDSWIREDSSNVNRVLSVSDNLSNQLFADFYFDIKATRAMPLYSIPGFIDHF
ncbi:major capsid protein [Capybara microvirus Cap1_SP_192]|nr:major capsid protein [Capybara microvirus Cap1_SP_192]